jgi:AcrR family transcriptional regulator
MMVRTLSPEKREQFLSAALRLFVQNGVQHTSTAAIAQEAGAAAGTLFLYFPTKQELIHELIIKIGREQSEYIKALLEPALPAREAFFTIWIGSVQWFMEHMDAYQYVQQVRDSGIIAPEVVQESGKFFDYYYAAIQKGYSEGRIKPYPAELIGGFLYQDIVGVMNLIRTLSDPAKVDEVVEHGFNIFWDGIKAGDESY